MSGGTFKREVSKSGEFEMISRLAGLSLLPIFFEGQNSHMSTSIVFSRSKDIVSCKDTSTVGGSRHGQSVDPWSDVGTDREMSVLLCRRAHGAPITGPIE